MPNQLTIFNTQETIFNKVGEILISYPDTRDNDGLLLKKYYQKEHHIYMESMSALDFFRALSKGKMVRPSTIERHSRTWQKNSKAHRGLKKAERMGKQGQVKEHQQLFKQKATG